MTDFSRIDAAIAKLFADIRFTDEPSGLYDPLRYMIGIGGKRIRPTLCLLAYSLFRDEFTPEVLEPAAALEVFHSFTLIHDDIMDNSPLRRGEPTVWKKWNSDTAILSGDVMLIDAYRRIAKAPARCLGDVLELFTETAAEVCEGQQYDMDFETRAEVSMADYEKMIGLKTAVLIACAAKMGALVAGASERECDALYQYGYQLGMAFQVADDYLDAYGDQKVFGKPIGGDILNGKKSWLTVQTLRKISDKGLLLDAMAMNAGTPQQQAGKIAAVKKIYESLGVDADAREEIKTFTARAMEAVSSLNLSSDAADALKTFAEKLVGRAK